MTVLHARFENGVFVPEVKVDLPAHKRVQVVIPDEPSAAAGAPTERPWDDPNDPMPSGGVALLEWWDRHRLTGLSPEVVRDLAESDEYLDQDGLDGA